MVELRGFEPMAHRGRQAAAPASNGGAPGPHYYKRNCFVAGLPQGPFEIAARCARGKQQPWKRKFAARDFRPHAPPMRRRDGGIDLADRLLAPQVAGISCYSAD